MKLEWKK